MGWFGKDPYVQRALDELHRNQEREKKAGITWETPEYKRLNKAVEKEEQRARRQSWGGK